MWIKTYVRNGKLKNLLSTYIPVNSACSIRNASSNASWSIAILFYPRVYVQQSINISGQIWACQFYTSIATAGHFSSTSWDQKFPQVSPVYPWVYRYDVSGHKSKGTQPLKMISSSCYVVWDWSGSLGYKQSTWLILFILACKTNLTALSWSPTKMTVKNKRSLPIKISCGFSAGGLFVDC